VSVLSANTSQEDGKYILSRLIAEPAIVTLAASKDVAGETLAAEKAVGPRLSATRLALQRGFK